MLKKKQTIKTKNRWEDSNGSINPWKNRQHKQQVYGKPIHMIVFVNELTKQQIEASPTAFQNKQKLQLASQFNLQNEKQKLFQNAHP